MGKFNRYSREQRDKLEGRLKPSLDELLEELDESVSALSPGRREQLIMELESETKEGVATNG